jgi:hypothetical protein
MSARQFLSAASKVNLAVTLPLPSVVGHAGVLEVMQPELSSRERSALERTVEGLRNALQKVGNQMQPMRERRKRPIRLPKCMSIEKSLTGGTDLPASH